MQRTRNNYSQSIPVISEISHPLFIGGDNYHNKKLANKLMLTSLTIRRFKKKL